MVDRHRGDNARPFFMAEFTEPEADSKRRNTDENVDIRVYRRFESMKSPPIAVYSLAPGSRPSSPTSSAGWSSRTASKSLNAPPPSLLQMFSAPIHPHYNKELSADRHSPGSETRLKSPEASSELGAVHYGGEVQLIAKPSKGCAFPALE
jgi:hypothetical protein